MSKSEQARRLKAEHPDWGTPRIAKQLGISKATVQQALKNPNAKPAHGSDRANSQAAELKPVSEFEENGDKATATTRDPNVRTLKDLLAFMQVDLNIWEVERHIVNKWEVVMREPATTVGGAGDKALISEGKHGSKSTLWTRQSNVPMHEPLFQVKAWLIRKTPLTRGLEEILKRIESGAPAMPSIKRPKPQKLSSKRTLEVCIMDPHIGLWCNYPESDAPWDLEMSAGCIMQSIEDLVAKAAPFAPFEEVVMPFGNDFTHSDNVFHTTTAGTGQPEALPWHRVYEFACGVAIGMVDRLREIAPVKIYQVPGNHSRMADFTMALLLKAHFRQAKDVYVDASSSPYKFHRCGVNLIGYEHGHSVKPIRLAALMANERRKDWSETEYREFHLGDQHRKGSSKPSMLEEQGVSVEYIPGLTAPNEWHRLKSFSHQKRGAMAFVWDWETGPLARFQHNIGIYTHKALERN
jgi:hypothetical protein